MSEHKHKYTPDEGVDLLSKLPDMYPKSEDFCPIDSMIELLDIAHGRSTTLPTGRTAALAAAAIFLIYVQGDVLGLPRVMSIPRGFAHPGNETVN